MNRKIESMIKNEANPETVALALRNAIMRNVLKLAERLNHEVPTPSRVMSYIRLVSEEDEMIYQHTKEVFWADDDYLNPATGVNPDDKKAVAEHQMHMNMFWMMTAYRKAFLYLIKKDFEFIF